MELMQSLSAALNEIERLFNFDDTNSAEYKGNLTNDEKKPNEVKCENNEECVFEIPIEDGDECCCKKRAEEKNAKIIDNANKMLEELCKKHSDKINENGKEMIEQAICENKEWLEKSTERNENITKQKECAKKRSYEVDNDGIGFYDPTKNNRFLIDIQGTHFNPEFWMIKGLHTDEFHRLHIFINEYYSYPIPMHLDESIDKGDRFTITKSILKPNGDVVYSVKYTGCTLIEYFESDLDYTNDKVRNFEVVFDYSDYEYIGG